MFEKVNPSHPDKIADRIAGALVDMAYAKEENPRIAVEVLIGHGKAFIVAETSVHLAFDNVRNAVCRITRDDNFLLDYNEYQQDSHLAENQKEVIRCGDNGIFLGKPVTKEQRKLSEKAKDIYVEYPYDGKYILDEKRGFVVCQSNADSAEIKAKFHPDVVNPLGEWTGGLDVDTGATNRKLGSDMGDSITGGGLHGKDLSKADVSINIYAFLKAQKSGRPIKMCCAIGDEKVNGIPYEKIVSVAKEYIASVGGFEKFAEWGLV